MDKPEEARLIFSVKTAFNETLQIIQVGSEVRVQKVINLEATVADAGRFLKSLDIAKERTLKARICI